MEDNERIRELAARALWMDFLDCQPTRKRLLGRIVKAIRTAVAEAVAVEREVLEYVYQQAPGDLLKSSIKDAEMIRVYLAAGVLRRIAAIRARGEEQIA